jgi:hypothetical protein
MKAEGNRFPEIILGWTTGLASRWKPIILAAIGYVKLFQIQIQTGGAVAKAKVDDRGVSSCVARGSNQARKPRTNSGCNERLLVTL